MKNTALKNGTLATFTAGESSANDLAWEYNVDEEVVQNLENATCKIIDDGDEDGFYTVIFPAYYNADESGSLKIYEVSEDQFLDVWNTEKVEETVTVNKADYDAMVAKLKAIEGILK